MNILKKLSVVVFLALLSSCSTLGEPTRVDREFVGLDDISITTSAVGVTVGKSPDSKVYLTYYEYDSTRESDPIRYNVEHDANKLVLTKQSGSYTYTGKPKALTILIPTAWSGTFNAVSSSGDINANGVIATDITLSSSSGDVKLDRLKANNINTRSSSGDITGSIVGDPKSDFASISTSSSSGSARPSSSTGNGSKKLNASSSSGDVNIIFVR